MNTIMNTAEFIRVTDLLKKEKIAKNSVNIFAAMMAMRENRPEAEISGGNQLIMNYEQAQELFGIKFRRWLGIFNL